MWGVWGLPHFQGFSWPWTVHGRESIDLPPMRLRGVIAEDHGSADAVVTPLPSGDGQPSRVIQCRAEGGVSDSPDRPGWSAESRSSCLHPHAAPPEDGYLCGTGRLSERHAASWTGSPRPRTAHWQRRDVRDGHIFATSGSLSSSQGISLRRRARHEIAPGWPNEAPVAPRWLGKRRTG